MYFILVNTSNNQIDGHWDVMSEANVPPAPTGFTIEQVTADQFETYLATLSPTNNQVALWQNNVVAVESITVALSEAQEQATAALLTNMNQFITYLPNGSIRYDQNFINSFLIWLQTKGTAGLTTPPAPALLAWQTAVKTFYFTTVAAIQAATTVAAVQAINISIAYFESQFGVSGTVGPDPNISTASLT
jgi:hypothetical protein